MGFNVEVPLLIGSYQCQNNSSSVDTDIHEYWLLLDTAKYDGATYYFEVVGANSHASTTCDVHLVDHDSNTEVATVTMPASGASTIVRQTPVQFTPTSGSHNYIIRIGPYVSSGYLTKIYSAWVTIVQANATKTRIQIPLFVYEGSAAYYGYPDTNYVKPSYNFVNWLKTESNWSSVSACHLESYFGANFSGTAYISLYDETDGNMVTGSEISNGTTIAYKQSSEFEFNATNFDDGHVFGVRSKMAGAYQYEYIWNLFLYITLDSSLSKVEISRFLSGYIDTVPGFYNGHRFYYDSARYSSISASYLDSYGRGYSTGYSLAKLYEDTDDTGDGATLITTSDAHGPGTTVTRSRVSASLTDEKRYAVKYEGQGETNVKMGGAWLVLVVEEISSSSASIDAPILTCSADKILAPIVSGITTIAGIPITASHVNILSPAVGTVIQINAPPLTGKNCLVIAATISGTALVNSSVLTAQNNKLLSPSINSSVNILSTILTAQSTKLLTPSVIVTSVIDATVDAIPITSSNCKLLTPSLVVSSIISSSILILTHAQILYPVISSVVSITAVVLTATHAKLLPPNIAISESIIAPVLTLSNAKILAPSFVISSVVNSSVLTASHTKILEPSLPYDSLINAIPLSITATKILPPSVDTGVGTTSITLNGYIFASKTKIYTIDGIISTPGSLYLDGRTYVTGGDADWYVENEVAKSGDINNDEVSWITYTAPSAETFAFRVGVSSEENYDFLTFYINDVEQFSISGEVSFTAYSYELEAEDVIKFEYSKDESESEGSDQGFFTTGSPIALATLDGFIAEEISFNGKTFLTYGNVPWYVDGEYLHSGDIEDNQGSYLLYVVPETETIKFSYVVSSQENHDYFNIYYAEYPEIELLQWYYWSGEQSGIFDDNWIVNAGDIIVYAYEKDENTSSGGDYVKISFEALKEVTIDGVIYSDFTTYYKAVSLTGTILDRVETVTIDGRIVTSEALTPQELIFNNNIFSTFGDSYWSVDGYMLTSGSVEENEFTTLTYTALDKKVMKVKCQTSSLPYMDCLYMYKNDRLIMQLSGNETGKGYGGTPEYELYDWKPYYDTETTEDYYFHDYGFRTDNDAPLYYLDLEAGDVVTWTYLKNPLIDGKTIYNYTPYSWNYGDDKAWLSTLEITNGSVATSPRYILSDEGEIQNPNGIYNTDAPWADLTFEQVCNGWHLTVNPPQYSSGDFGNVDGGLGGKYVQQAIIEFDIDISYPIKDISLILGLSHIYNNDNPFNVEVRYFDWGATYDNWGTGGYEDSGPCDFVDGENIPNYTLLATGNTGDIYYEGNDHQYGPDFAKLDMEILPAFKTLLNQYVGLSNSVIKLVVLSEGNRTYTPDDSQIRLDYNSYLVLNTQLGRIYVGGHVLRGAKYSGKYTRLS